MRRAVITGLGIVSCIGIDKKSVEESLRKGTSGITKSLDYEEHGFRSRVHGKPDINIEDFIDKRQLRFMGDGAAFNFIAMQQAIDDSGLEEKKYLMIEQVLSLDQEDLQQKTYFLRIKL